MAHCDLNFSRRICGLKQDRTKKDAPLTRPKPGRPRADQAGEVERRILDAATALFLEQGFGRAALDQVAELAHVGKTTLYSRYATKQALFEAVIRECVETFLQDMETKPAQGTLEEKLVQVGTALGQATLTPYVISIMRITLAETDRFPEIAKEAFRLGFGACVQSIAAALSDCDEPMEVERALGVGKRFVELALHPLYFHAFFGDNLEDLNDRISGDVAQVARMLSKDLE
ncbi:MAG: TetR/AcrR family transcriptional regulator [Cytophagaceae bacterium]|nr:MAG: TetR/AcrR family transcriptional regulator [Cytophagaceae bacterium]